MKTLLFLTDRYPFSYGETFIENEIFILSKKFEKIIILPTAMMMDCSTMRSIPQNVTVIEPPIKHDLFLTKPSKSKIILWSLQHMLGWIILSLSNKIVREELSSLLKGGCFSFKRIALLFKRAAPAYRNTVYYNNKLKLNGDVYIYSYWLEPTFLLMLSHLPKKNIRKIICRAHAIDLYSERNSENYLSFQESIIKACDNVCLISRHGYEYISRKYPQFKSKYRLSRLGTTDYGVENSKINDDVFKIVSCSHIIPLKRVHLIVDAIAYYAKMSNTKIEWTHFGKGTDFYIIQKYAETMLEMANIDYNFYGAISNRDLMNYYSNNRVDLFISTSETEGLPVSIMEAISFGIPVIATDVGGTREVVIDGVNGFLLNKDFSDNDIYMCMKSVFLDSRGEQYYRQNSRRIWLENYNGTVNYESFIKHLL